MKNNRILAMFFLATFGMVARSEVTIPYILSDNMVLQRDIPLNIWGWAKPGEKVTVILNDQSVSVKTGKEGEWMVHLKPIAAGGPYELKISGTNAILLKNILVGDVWVCSGQSNMEWPLSLSRNWQTDKNNLENPLIRLFYVPKNTSTKPLVNTKESAWQPCNEKSASVFSAIGYYFGRELSGEINVPVGLINSNWGGTDIETWTSLETMYADRDYTSTIDKMKSLNLEELQKEAEKRTLAWQQKINSDDPGILEKWYLPETNVTRWERMKLPQTWEGGGLPGLDGVVWYRKDFILSAGEDEKETTLSLGPIDDQDLCYVNGTLVGNTSQYDIPRIYTIAPGILKAGINTICIKVIDTGGGGGLWGNESQMFLKTNGSNVELAGEWQYRVGFDLPAPGDAAGPNSYPSLLYNGMISPLVQFPIRGVIWYQGESNADHYIKYRSLFQAMINDWRTKWNNASLTFLFVQLANYMEPSENPQESSWAGLREAQTMALQLPQTGMAVAIDIGERKDIHPRNKDDVGRRLALAALKTTYSKDIVYSGPMYKSMTIRGNSIVVDFDNAGSGLVVRDKYGYLKAFAIAGGDGKFVWARAEIASGNRVVVSAPGIDSPVAVRYAWADNPDDANLYNKEGLPASPFRTDNW